MACGDIFFPVELNSLTRLGHSLCTELGENALPWWNTFFPQSSPLFTLYSRADTSPDRNPLLPWHVASHYFSFFLLLYSFGLFYFFSFGLWIAPVENIGRKLFSRSCTIPAWFSFSFRSSRSFLNPHSASQSPNIRPGTLSSKLAIVESLFSCSPESFLYRSALEDTIRTLQTLFSSFFPVPGSFHSRIVILSSLQSFSLLLEGPRWKGQRVWIGQHKFSLLDSKLYTPLNDHRCGLISKFHI